MEPPKRFDLNYSLKNIPIPTPPTYTARLIEKTESLIKRMRWRAFHFLKGGPADDEHDTKNNFGFKTTKCPPRIEELEPFEDDLLRMVETIQFRKATNSFQQRLREDGERVRKSKDIIVPADKTRNLYAVSKDQYDKLLRDNITKTYKLAATETYDDINREAQEIARALKLDDRIECMAKKDAYITLKDHKDNFPHALPCRLINPAKSEIGTISKSILDNILTDVQRQLQLNMWKSTSSVIDWFEKIHEKQRCTFVSFDIVEYYPSISEDLLKRALNFASNYTNISQQDIAIIFHARKSMLFAQDQEWTKRDTGLFDVTMGCFDGAEICELVGAFAITTLVETLNKGDFGLYRDDGLGVLWDLSGPESDRIRKDIIKVFADLGLRITIQTNLKMTNFLDATLNLTTGKHYPYRKPNDRPMYIHQQSNHPPNIIRNIPASINRRLTDLSSDQATFSEATPVYDAALKESGYTEKTQYLELRKEGKERKRRNRRRTITWFNPPFSANVSTNVGRRFRCLVAKHFPKNSTLYKIFNPNTLKISYSCMPNMAATIKHHNNQIIRESHPPKLSNADARTCNCRKKDQCPLDNTCLSRSIVYKATVATENTAEDPKEYIGLTANTFKERFNAHQNSIRHRKHEHSTALSKHVWSLKNSNTNYKIKWSVHQKATAYTNKTKRCNLCLAEKVAIITADKASLLNRRSELVSKCRHQGKFCLSNFPPPIS